jgi:hypothetical protein
MYWMASAACSRPKTKKEAMCSLISTALNPITGMLAAQRGNRRGNKGAKNCQVGARVEAPTAARHRI